MVKLPSEKFPTSNTHLLMIKSNINEVILKGEGSNAY
jgi:hypothetical protein